MDYSMAFANITNLKYFKGNLKTKVKKIKGKYKNEKKTKRDKNKVELEGQR